MTRSQIASLGGKARAAKLSPERRSQIAYLGLVGFAEKHCGGNLKLAREKLALMGRIKLDSYYAPELRKWTPDQLAIIDKAF